MIRDPAILKDIAEVPELGNNVLGGFTHKPRLYPLRSKSSSEIVFPEQFRCHCSKIKTDEIVLKAETGGNEIALSSQTHSTIALPQQQRSPNWGNNNAIAPSTKNRCESERETLANCDR
jgi:hypothetical protein